jgi:hypothetical protein
MSITLEEGVCKRIISEGTGTIPPKGSLVKVHYTGTLASDGTKFDSSRDREDPFVFSLGKGQVIRGWDCAVATMRIGERSIITCAPEAAYGKAGSPPTIPPNSTLDFDVELLDFELDPTEPTECWDYCVAQKEKGNSLVKEAPKLALEQYEKAMKKIDLCYNGTFKEKAEIDALKVSLLLNASLAAASSGPLWKKSEEFSRKALSLNPTSEKAVYRLAIALANQGKFTEAHDEISCFAASSAEIEALKTRITLMKREVESKQKALYSRMFQ